MKCNECQIDAERAIAFDASIVDCIGLFFIGSLIFLPALFFWVKYLIGLTLLPFTTYEAGEDITNNLVVFIAVSWMCGWAGWKVFHAIEVVSPVIKILSYFLNFSLKVKYTCKNCCKVIYEKRIQKKLNKVVLSPLTGHLK